MSANDRQVGGTHYQTFMQPWDLFIAYGIGFMEANIVKYVTRWRKKAGTSDLEKARHYLDKLYEVHELKAYPPNGNYVLQALRPMLKLFGLTDDKERVRVPYTVIEDYAHANDVNRWELDVIELVLNWEKADELELAGQYLDELIEGSDPSV